MKAHESNVRDHQNRGALKKRFGCFLRALIFLGKWCGVTTYFFIQKNKKKLNTNLHD